MGGPRGLSWGKLSLTRVPGAFSWLHGTSETQVTVAAGRTKGMAGRSLKLQAPGSLFPPPLNTVGPWSSQEIWF